MRRFFALLLILALMGTCFAHAEFEDMPASEPEVVSVESIPENKPIPEEENIPEEEIVSEEETLPEEETVSEAEIPAPDYRVILPDTFEFDLIAAERPSKAEPTQEAPDDSPAPETPDTEPAEQ